MQRHLHRVKHHLKNAFIPHEGNDYRPHAIRHHWLGVYAAAIVLVKIVAIGVVGFYSTPVRLSDVTASNIINLTNKTRQKNQVATLTVNSLLNRAAQSKADNMLREQYFAHVSPSNLTPWHWFKRAGYAYRYAGENLAIDYVESEDVMAAWLASPSHRTNLLSPKFRDLGVAVVSGKFQGAQSILVVQMFGTPLPKTTTRLAAQPAQTPNPTVVKEELSRVASATDTSPAPSTSPPPAPAPVSPTPPAPAPPPPPVPPATPSIATPDPEALLRTKTPTVVGQAEAASRVELLIDGRVVGATIAGQDGVYSLSPEQTMADGPHRLTVRAVARGLTSPNETARLVTVDTTPPTVDQEQSYALISAVEPDTYDVAVATSADVVSVRCSCGSNLSFLTRQGGAFVGQVRVNSRQNPSSVLSVVVSDQVGNEARVGLVDTDLFTAGVAAAKSGPVVKALNVVTYSRNFLMAFLVAMLIVAVLNVIIHLERQHHPTIVGTLMVLYLTVSLLLI